jgi:hypothetical protein
MSAVLKAQFCQTNADGRNLLPAANGQALAQVAANSGANPKPSEQASFSTESAESRLAVAVL